MRTTLSPHQALAAAFRQVRRPAALVAACLAVFSLVAALYGMPAGAIGYALLLCAALLIAAYVMTLARCVRQHQAAAALLRSLPDGLETYPEPDSPADADNRQLLHRMAQLYRDAVFQADSRYEATTAYYTMWSHQVKTPLAAMRLLLAGEDTPLARQLLGELFKTEQYVDMALNYMRLDGGPGGFSFRSCLLRSVAADAARPFGLLFAQKKLRFAIDISENISVVTDAQWLSFALEQLLSNAVKYTAQGGVTISWDARAGELCVADTGRGIRPEDLPRVTEFGFTGSSASGDSRPTGIGLYLCGLTLKRLGHTLRLASDPGRGTRAYIRFHQRTLAPQVTDL